MKVFAGIDELEKAVGSHLGYSDWHTVTQEQVDRFADATGDHQWIHVDPVRAARGPFGATIVHGYPTLSMVPRLVWEACTVDGPHDGRELRRQQGPVPLARAGRLPCPGRRRAPLAGALT